MSLQRYLDVAQAPDVDTFKARLIDFAHHMDFGLISGGLIVERPGLLTPAESYWVTNTPQAYLESFLSVPESSRDPVMSRLKRLSIPFVYDQQTYVSEGVSDLWDHQAVYGYKTGVAVALHLPQSRHFLIGVDRERPLPRSETKLTRLMADLQLLAVHAQDAASRLFTPSLAPDMPSLTAREIEILRWSMEGKTSWAIGAIIGLTEHGVNHHLRSVFRKLDVTTRQQAVVKAMALGLV